MKDRKDIFEEVFGKVEKDIFEEFFGF